METAVFIQNALAACAALYLLRLAANLGVSLAAVKVARINGEAAIRRAQLEVRRAQLEADHAIALAVLEANHRANEARLDAEHQATMAQIRGGIYMRAINSNLN